MVDWGRLRKREKGDRPVVRDGSEGNGGGGGAEKTTVINCILSLRVSDFERERE